MKALNKITASLSKMVSDIEKLTIQNNKKIQEKEAVISSIHEEKEALRLEAERAKKVAGHISILLGGD